MVVSCSSTGTFLDLILIVEIFNLLHTSVSKLHITSSTSRSAANKPIEWCCCAAVLIGWLTSRSSSSGATGVIISTVTNGVEDEELVTLMQYCVLMVERFMNYLKSGCCLQGSCSSCSSDWGS